MKRGLLFLIIAYMASVTGSVSAADFTSTPPPAGPVFTTMALEYTACQGDSVYIETTLTDPYTYKVYTTPTGNVLSCPTTPTYFRKTNAATEVAYVQAFQGTTPVGSRLAVNVRPSAFCGATTDQNVDGLVLYYEDFGGNNVSDPEYSSTPLPMDSEIDLTFHAGNNVGSGHYGLIKHIIYDYAIVGNSDHTHPNDPTRGYFMMIDPIAGDINATMYVGTISNLCVGASLAFSFWASDMHCCVTARPKFDIQLINPENNQVLVQSNVWTPDRSGDNNVQIWNQYGFTYTVPEGIHSVKFRIANRWDNYTGNDYGIDDIKVMFTGGTIVQAPGTELSGCYNSTITMQNTVTYDPADFTDPAYKWQYTKTPDNAASWQDLPNSNTSTWTISNATPANSGYYRMFLANSTVIAGAPGNGSCLLKTAENYHVTVYPQFTAGAISNGSQTVCAGDAVSTIGNVTSASGGNGAITYQWYLNGSLLSDATGATFDPTSYKSTVGTYVFTRKAKAASCSNGFEQSQGTWTLTVNPKPAPVITGSSTACFNADLNLSTQTGMATYNWSVDGGTISSGAGTANINVQWSSGGNKTVGLTVTNSDGCSTSTSKAIQVYGELTPGTINYGETSCNTGNATVTITSEAAASGGTNGHYEWQKSTTSATSGFTSIASTNTATYNPPASYHTYFRRAYVTDCGTVYSNAVYIVNSGNVSAGSITGSNAAYCANSTVSHTVNVSNIDVASGAPYTVQWQSSVNGGTTWSNVGTPITSTTADKSYTYTTSNFTQAIQFRYQIALEGCDPFNGNGVVQLSKYSLPSVSITPVAQLCPNVGSTSLIGTVTTETTPDYTFTWGGDLTVSTATATQTATTHTTTATIPATPCNTTYNVTLGLTDDHGCTANASTTVTVKDETGPVIEGSLPALTEKGCEATAAPAAYQTAAALAEVLTGEGAGITDGCSSLDQMTVYHIDSPEGTCPIVVTRTYTVKDACTNVSNEVTQTITIEREDFTARQRGYHRGLHRTSHRTHASDRQG